MTWLEYWTHDFFVTVNFWIPFAGFLLEFLTGTGMAIKNGAWNSRLA